MFTLFCRWLLSKILPTPALHKAAASGELPRLRELLRTGTPVDKRDAYGTQTLHVAASAGQSEAIRLLVEARADVNAFAADGETPLHRAVGNNHLEAMKLLLQLGAKVDAMASDSFSFPVVHHSLIQRRGRDVVEILLNAGASTNLRDSEYGMTALHVAANAKAVEKNLVSFLVERGADLNAMDKKGQTALHHAVGFGRFETAQSLIDLGADINAVDKNGNTPLHNAAGSDTKMVLLLLRNGASVDLVNKDGKIPVEIARFCKDTASIKAFANFANEAKTSS